MRNGVFLFVLGGVGLVLAMETLQVALADSPDNYASCDLKHPNVGKPCRQSVVDSILPTQVLLGMHEVNCKVDKFSGMSSSDLQDYLASNPIPAVAGVDGYHITDHHHLCAALTQAYTSSAVNYHHILINVTLDFTSLDEEALLKELIETQLVWLYDGRGNQPLDPHLIPTDVSRLVNDPYRSLAYLVRCNGGYQKEPVPYQDFYWGNYFRSLNLLPAPEQVVGPSFVTKWTTCQAMPYDLSFCDNTSKVFASALKEALVAATQPAAAGLPGYTSSYTPVACDCAA